MEHELPPTASIPEADIFILLSDRRRRQTLRILQGTTSPPTTIELARRIANREHDAPSAQEVQTVHLALHNDHLPRLDEADVVEYDVNEQTIRPGVNFSAITDFLAKVNETDLPWSGQ